MSIRVRLTVVFSLVAAILASVGAYVFARTFSAALTANVDAQLAAQVAQAGRALPSATAPARPALPGEFLLQLVDPAGVVSNASAEAGDHALLPARLLGAARTGVVHTTLSSEGESLRALAAPVAGRPGWVAVAAVSLEPTNRTIGDVSTELVIAGAALVLLTGVGAFLLAGAALAPVERLRREAEQLSGARTIATLAVPRTHDELARLATTLNELLGRLADVLRRERRLVADASHELRTPLAVLRGELELASRPGRSPAELAAAVAHAAAEAERLSRLTDDLLLLARRDAGRLVLARRPSALGALLDASAARCAARAGAVSVTATPPPEDPTTVLVDPDRLAQALDNLLDNAARLVPAGSLIELTARVLPDRLVIAVTDEGPGFDAAFLPHAFEPFSRPEDARGRATGSAGLGLAIVAAVVEAHGGSVRAENRPTGGAVVVIEIPQTAVADDPLSPAAADAAHAT